MILGYFSTLLTRDLEAVIREIEAYPDEASVWQTPPGINNSAGSLALHCAGNLHHFIGTVLGGSEYRRDRDAEFADRNLPKSEIVSRLRQAREAVEETLNRVSEKVLEGDFPEALGGHRQPAIRGLAHIATHLAYHLGQVDYHRRMVTGQGPLKGILAAPKQ